MGEDVQTVLNINVETPRGASPARVAMSVLAASPCRLPTSVMMPPLEEWAVVFATSTNNASYSALSVPTASETNYDKLEKRSVLITTILSKISYQENCCNNNASVWPWSINYVLRIILPCSISCPLFASLFLFLHTKCNPVYRESDCITNSREFPIFCFYPCMVYLLLFAPRESILFVSPFFIILCIVTLIQMSSPFIHFSCQLIQVYCAENSATLITRCILLMSIVNFHLKLSTLAAAGPHVKSCWTLILIICHEILWIL
jgi:hypothetical protein